MKRLDEIIIRNSPTPPATDSSADDDSARMPREELFAWGNRFREIAAEVCPGFVIDSDNRTVLNQLLLWALQQPHGDYDPDKGLWLEGTNGTGKSTILRILKLFCRECRPLDLDGNPYGFRIAKAYDIAADYQRDGDEGIRDYLDSSRLAIDELGAEAIASHYGNQQNVLQRLLLHHYDKFVDPWHDSFLHVTTNLTAEDIVRRYGDRVFDRVREMFNIIPLIGPSRR